MPANKIGKTARIITVGNEITTGKITDTNSVYLSRYLFTRGYHIDEILSVGDRPEAIKSAVRRALKGCSLLIVTGGLGPTHDDITKNAVCSLFKSKIKYNPAVQKQVEKFFRKRGRKVPLVNRSYAEIPHNAIALENRAGVAPGLFFENKVLLLPGVPIEMKSMIEQHGKKIIPHGGNHFLEKTFRTVAGETELMKKITSLDAILENAEVAFLPHAGRTDVRIIVSGKSANEAKTRLRSAEKLLTANIKDRIWGYGNENIEDVVGKMLRKAGKILSVAESCTGGGIGEAITSLPGSSDYFLGGIIAYSDRVKIEALDVSGETIKLHGAVSEETAMSMARGVRERMRSDFGISATGIAGPGGGSKEKPVGLIYVAVSDVNGEVCEKLLLGPSRSYNRERTVFEALYLLYTRLKGETKTGGSEEGWHVYIVQCADGTYYCGVSNDVEKRIETHNQGKGAKYTRTRLPVKLLKKSVMMTKSEAHSLERRIKCVPREMKLSLLDERS